MDEKDEMPFDREPWKRLLAGTADAPPETTDARIRAAARRDLAPRGHRWWLPASLAASFVLAVFVVQSQLGKVRVPVATESETGAGGAMEARIIDREESKEMREPGRAATAPSTRAKSEQRPEPAEEYGYEDAELAADSAGTGPRVGGPERELRAASESPDDLPAAAPPDTAARASPHAAESQDSTRAAARVRTPEDWYAEIEELRAEGRTEEADRELLRLEKAYPGWLAQYLAEREQR
jgi:hypothetical protein